MDQDNSHSDEPTEVKINRFMDRGQGRPDWISRDWGLPTIPCNVGECPACINRQCTMPSAINIDADGRCQLGKNARDDGKSKRK